MNKLALDVTMLEALTDGEARAVNGGSGPADGLDPTCGMGPTGRNAPGFIAAIRSRLGNRLRNLSPAGSYVWFDPGPVQ